MTPQPGPRVALYYAPTAADPLAAAGAAWLGRDADTGAPMPQPDVADLPAITADARRYGFHATLKPPMRLRPGTRWTDVMLGVERVAACVPAFALPPLAVADLDGFLALREAGPSPALQALADLCVAGLDPWREPPDAAELAQRRRHGLGPAEEATLLAWGYPHAFATWRFHMTLSRRLDQPEAARLHRAAQAHFAAALAQPRTVADICVFTQAAPGADFLLAERVGLRG